MKIAFIVNNYPPRTGGVELHVHALAQELCAQGHTVLVVDLGPQPGHRHDGPVRVVTLREHFRVADTLGFPRPGSRRALTRLLREERVDVVSVHTRFFPMSFVGLRAAHAAAVPVIHTEHGSDHVVSGSAVIAGASRFVDTTVGRRVLRGADKVLGVSEAVTAFVRRLSGVEAEVFYNAIPVPDPVEHAQKQDPFRAVFVGRLVPGKGWDTYLDALASLRSSGIPVTGDLIGDGPDMARVRDRVRTLHLEDAVDVRGQLPQQGVRRALRGATLVNPTLLSEGFQTTLLEAIIEGGRVVTYAVPGAHLLREQGAPVLVAEVNTPESLIAALRSELGRSWSVAPAELVDKWTWPARARQFVGFCTGFVRRPTP